MRMVLFGGLLGLAVLACDRDQPRLDIGAAAVLRNAMPELVEAYGRKSGVRVAVTYGASDALATQVDRGVAFDGVIFAEHPVLDELIVRGRIAPDSKRSIATTTLVLVGPQGSGHTFSKLAGLPDNAKVAIGDPAAVPAGRYARDYLQTIGLWATIEPRLIYGGDVAGVLALAQRGSAEVAIVYRTDAAGAAPLVILDQPASAPSVGVVAGVVASSRDAKPAADFLDYLASADARAILARHGFTPSR